MWANFIAIIPFRISLLGRLRPVESQIKDHDGKCLPVWVNRSQIDNRLDGGVTGFFRKSHTVIPRFFYWLTGPEFHGMVPWRAKHVESTQIW